MDYMKALFTFDMCGCSLSSVAPANVALCLAFVVAVCCAVRRFCGVSVAVASLASCDTARALLAPVYQGHATPYEGTARAAWLAFGILPVMIPPTVYLWVGCRVRAAWLPVALTAAVGVAYPALRGPLLLDVIFGLYASTYILVAARSTVRAFRSRAMGESDLMLVTLSLTGLASIALVRLYGCDGWGGVPITYSAGLVAVGALALGSEQAPPPQGDETPREAAAS
jgi:hypothetical protein